MKITYAPGGSSWKKIIGDCNVDGIVDNKDRQAFNKAAGGELYSSNTQKQAIYNDLCDLDNDGKVNINDVRIIRSINP